MDRLDHLEHLDRELVDELAQVARETVRDELREQTRKQRRRAALYAASGATALYAGAAVSLAVGLALALELPDWAAALITAALLGAVAYVLRGMARPAPPRPAASGPEGMPGADVQAASQSGAADGGPYPPMPSVPPTAGTAAPRPESGDAGAPHDTRR